MIFCSFLYNFLLILLCYLLIFMVVGLFFCSFLLILLYLFVNFVLFNCLFCIDIINTKIKREIFYES